MVAVVVVCEPLLLTPGEFFSSKDMRNFLPSMKIAKGQTIRIWGLYDFSTTPYLFFITHLFRYALGRLLLREVYLAEGRHADAKRELRRIADSGLSAGAYVGLIRVGMAERGARYLNRYIKLTAEKKTNGQTLLQYGWLIKKIRAERIARRENSKQSSQSTTQPSN